MSNMKILLYIFSLLVLASFAGAATVHGTIYDLSLKKVNNARIEINTAPKQFIVSVDGSYSFNAPNGAYMIKAQLLQNKAVLASVNESITISQDGNYVLDLILFPNIEEGIEDPGIDISGNITDTNGNKNIVWAGVLILIVIAVAAVVYYLKSKPKGSKIESEINKKSFEVGDLDQIVEIIKKDGGRTTQKEIRKQIPLSEAKISLMIAELEHKGVIEKIKKGRGNIIILKKKE